MFSNKFRSLSIKDPKEKANFLSEMLSKSSYISHHVSQAIHEVLKKRKQFTYSYQDIIHYFLWCLCLRKKKFWRKKEEFKTHFIYRKGESRVVNELDCINLIKMIR